MFAKFMLCLVAAVTCEVAIAIRQENTQEAAELAKCQEVAETHLVEGACSDCVKLIDSAEDLASYPDAIQSGEARF